MQLHVIQNAVKRRSLRQAAAVLAAGLLATAGSAHAAITLPSVGDVVTAIEGVPALVGSIGTAVLGVVVTVALFRWIRGALR